MKLIKPSEISASILTLLDESDERILIEIYVRDDPDNTATDRDLDQLALEYKKIPHLHS